MSVYNFFSKLKQQVGSFHQGNSIAEGSSSSPETFPRASPTDDSEYDGYLLIGETRNASISQLGTDNTLNGLMPGELPYNNKPIGEITNISGPTMFSRVNILPLKSEDLTPIQSQRSPLSDIPFKLHPSLDAKMQADALFHNLNLEPRSFDWAKYSHDFISENLSLRDMNSDELANIDEFLLQPADKWPDTKLPSGNSEVSLMQF